MKVQSRTNHPSTQPAPGIDQFYPRVAGGMAMALGLWLFLSPFVLGFVQPTRLNHMLVGVVTVLAGGTLLLRIFRPVAVAAFLALIGAWLIIAPLAMPIGERGSWNEIGVGATLLIVALLATVPRAGRHQPA